MRDLSFGVVPSAFATFTASGEFITINKADLSDQGTPMQYEPAEVSGYVPDLNGEFIVYRKPAPILFSFTLLPYTPSDCDLIDFLYCCISRGDSPQINQAVVHVSESATITYTDGTLLSGIPGVGANNEGRMESHTYRFMFGGMKLQGYNERNGMGR